MRRLRIKMGILEVGNSGHMRGEYGCDEQGSGERRLSW